ncbi:tetratricopeptide repeat protein [Nitrosophilus alvini]|uniref:tetratricopeptide repeat protein n=1 Tax=Nitrosophilus alvini TaxID=2714855 RepID=UPI00190AB1E0|nr:tetratricopeptide repeat protein [Nitrosophilus alvini]
MSRIVCFLMFSALVLCAAEVDRKSEKRGPFSNSGYFYTIQIFSAKGPESTKRFVSKLPAGMKENVMVFQSGKYYAVRYGYEHNLTRLKKILYKIKERGYKDSFLVKMKKSRLKEMIKFFEKGSVVEKKKIVKTRITKNIQKNFNKPKNRKKTIFFLNRAHDFYRKGAFGKSLEFYLKAYNSGAKEEKTLANIAFLCGKTSNDKLFEKLLFNSKDKERLLYAYGAGAIESGFLENAKKILIKYRHTTYSGFCDLLLGLISEKEKDLPKALYFYKAAYKKDISNPFFIYSYARALDMAGDLEKALKIYKKCLSSADNRVVEYAQLRIQQIYLYKMNRNRLNSNTRSNDAKR